MKIDTTALLVAGSLISATASLRAQDAASDVRTRQLWNESYRKQRPQSPTVDNAFIGVTLWRFRVSQHGDAPGTRMLVFEPRKGEPDNKKTVEYTPERAEANTPLAEDHKVRISIESARSGYLYVVNREQYQGDAYGDALLIFPTLNIRDGDNHVQAGTTVDIPAKEEGLFGIKRNRPDQVGEEITIIVSPKQIEGLKIGDDPLKVNDQFARWKAKWTAPVKPLEEPGQAGKNITSAEKKAMEEGAALTDADPLPQTLFHVSPATGDPMLITLTLKIK